MLKPYLPYADYCLNPDYVAKYCVNKAKPALKCNGKCHLKKVLIDDDRTDDSSEKKGFKAKFTIDDHLPQIFCFSFSKAIEVILKHKFKKIKQANYFVFHLKLLRPPIF